MDFCLLLLFLVSSFVFLINFIFLQNKIGNVAITNISIIISIITHDCAKKFIIIVNE